MFDKDAKDTIEELKQQNEQLKQEKCELLGIIQQKDELIEKMKCCANCKKYRMLESQMTLKCLKNQRTNFCCNEWERMTIDEKTLEAMSKIYIKSNDDYIPLEEVTSNVLKLTSYIQIFIEKIIEIVKSSWSKKHETL